MSDSTVTLSIPRVRHYDITSWLYYGELPGIGSVCMPFCLILYRYLHLCKILCEAPEQQKVTHNMYSDTLNLQELQLKTSLGIDILNNECVYIEFLKPKITYTTPI